MGAPLVDPTITPVVVYLEKWHCISQEDNEFIADTQDDEPYIIAMAVDARLGPGNLPRVAASISRVGPVDDIDEGDIKPAPANVLWGPDGFQSPIADISRVFFLIQLYENDHADPQDTENRFRIATAALPGLAILAASRTDLTELERFAQFVTTARQAADGIASFAGFAVPDPDDCIDVVKVLSFTPQELQSVVDGTVPRVERLITFEGDDAKYNLTFVLSLRFSIPDRTPIASLRRRTDRMEIWVVDSSGCVQGAYWDLHWRTWYALPNPAARFPQRGRLAVLHRHDEHMELFGIGQDGQLYHNWWNGEWQGWNSLGSPVLGGLAPGETALLPGAPLAVRSRFEDHMEVWTVGRDGQVHGIWWDGANWRDWFTVGGAQFPLNAHIAVHSRNENHMELWAIDVDGVLRGNFWNGNWNGWYSLPAPFNLMRGGAIAVASRHDEHMELWTVSGGDRLAGVWWNGDWQPWYVLPGPFSFMPGGDLVAISRNENHMEVWAAGDDNRLHGVWWQDDWRPWYTLEDLPSPRGAPLAAMSRDDEHMEVWVVGPDGAPVNALSVHSVWWDGSWHEFYRLG